MPIVLAFVIGALVVAAVTVGVLRLAQRRWQVESTDSFVADANAADVRARIIAIAAHHRGWRIPRTDHPDADVIVIKGRTTPWTWTKTITCRVVDYGSMPCTAAISCTTPQLYDWGECRRTVLALRRDLTNHPEG